MTGRLPTMTHTVHCTLVQPSLSYCNILHQTTLTASLISKLKRVYHQPHEADPTAQIATL